MFNAIHDTYDNITFLNRAAERLVSLANIAPGQRVLDVACGTGWATMKAAQATGKTGRVIGIDVADKMLDVARAKAKSIGLSNLNYRLGDAEALEFEDGVFDAVICASSIFFLKDISKALREWQRVLKEGGSVAFSSFGAGFGQPCGKLFSDRLSRFDGQASLEQQAVDRTNTPDKCIEFLTRTGFKDIRVTTEQLGGYIKSIPDYWLQMTSSVIRLRLNRLSPAAFDEFKREHLAEIEYLRTDQGIWMDAIIHFSLARK